MRVERLRLAFSWSATAMQLATTLSTEQVVTIASLGFHDVKLSCPRIRANLWRADNGGLRVANARESRLRLIDLQSDKVKVICDRFMIGNVR